MLSWANKHLEKLAETLAPPPAGPEGASVRILTALASQDQGAALSILSDPSQPVDPNAPLNQRGATALHVAAGHGAAGVVRELVAARGCGVDRPDAQGWTALHHAAASNSIDPQQALAMVKLLVEEFMASVLSRNANSQTPYDVASSQAVRGYLLPKQLQAETMIAGDGGAGSVPPPPTGHGVHPPPPAGGVIPGPPQPFVSNDPSAALMQPPVNKFVSKPTYAPGGNTPYAATAGAGAFSPTTTNDNFQPAPQPTNAVRTNDQLGAMMHPPASTFASSAPIQGVSDENVQAGFSSKHANDVGCGQMPPPPINEQSSRPSQPQIGGLPPPPQLSTLVTTAPPAASMQLTTSQVGAISPLKTTESQNGETVIQNQAQKHELSKLPASGSRYALRGGSSNSASVLNESEYKASGRKLYVPDGFHSSSNDRELQAKYGHVENDFERSRKLAVPPPPISGGAPISGGSPSVAAGGSVGSVTVGPPSSGGYNPYSALGASGGKNAGYIAGAGRSRYPTYNVTPGGSESVSAPPSLGGVGGAGNRGVSVPAYATFNPATAANPGGNTPAS